MPDINAAKAHFRRAREHIKKAEAALDAPDPATAKVLATVTREMRLAEVIKATGLVEDVAAQACARLVRRGELRRVRTGVYAPTGGGA